MDEVSVAEEPNFSSSYISSLAEEPLICASMDDEFSYGEETNSAKYTHARCSSVAFVYFVHFFRRPFIVQGFLKFFALQRFSNVSPCSGRKRRQNSSRNISFKKLRLKRLIFIKKDLKRRYG